MKKFWMISMLLIAALFVISCGESEDVGISGNDDACMTQNAFRCKGDILQKCDQEKWINFQQCTAEQNCNATTGKCDPKSNNSENTGDNGNNEPTNPTEPTEPTTPTDPTEPTTPTDPTEPTTPDQSAMEACTDIYQCFSQCETNECAQACFDNGDPAGQQPFMDMYNCWSDNCASASDFTSCAKENCLNETEACGLSFGEEGNTAYPAPYGHLDINVSSTYILTNETSIDQSMVNMSYFATGTFGTNGNTQPMGAQGAYYYAALDSDVVQIFQTPFANNGQTTLNPAVVLVIGSNVAPGNITVGLTQDDAAQLFVVDLNGNSVGCYHAFAVGTLTVNTMNVAAGSAGNIAIVGSQIEIYSTENAPMYGGNITSQMGAGFSACPAQ